MDARSGEFLRALLARQQVVLHRGGGGDAGANAILRDVRKAQLADLAGCLAGYGLAVYEHIAAAQRTHAGDGFDQLALTVAFDGGDAQNLTRAHIQAHTLHGGQHAVGEHLQILHADALVARVAGLFQLGVQHLAADHHAGQHALVDLAGVLQAHQLARAHHAHAVGDRHDLVELVGDDDDRHALVAHDAPDDPEQLVGLLGGQHGGGLVQNQHVRAPVQGLEDLHALLKSHAQGIDLRAGIDLQTEFLGEPAHRVVGGPEVVQAQLLLRLAAQCDVLRHGERAHQLEVLVHHAHAHGDGLGWALLLHPLSLDIDRAACGLVEAVEHVHQRGFARAVFAHQRKDLAGVDVQRHVVVGQHAGELHGDVLKANDGLAFRHADRSFPCLRIHLEECNAALIGTEDRSGRCGLRGIDVRDTALSARNVS